MRIKQILIIAISGFLNVFLCVYPLIRLLVFVFRSSIPSLRLTMSDIQDVLPAVVGPQLSTNGASDNKTRLQNNNNNDSKKSETNETIESADAGDPAAAMPVVGTTESRGIVTSKTFVANTAEDTGTRVSELADNKSHPRSIITGTTEQRHSPPVVLPTQHHHHQQQQHQQPQHRPVIQSQRQTESEVTSTLATSQANTQQQQQQQQPQQQQQHPPPPTPLQLQQPHQNRQPGECNLLPVLVERLRSALELSCSRSQSSEELRPLQQQQPQENPDQQQQQQQQQSNPTQPEDSGIDSEEDFRLQWSRGGCVGPESTYHATSPHNHHQIDLKFLEDVLLADISTGLARLQETLRRLDATSIARYNASLDPANKLYLLRLISGLLQKLRFPEDEPVPLGQQHQGKLGQRRLRQRPERHTISVSAEEISGARKWLEEQQQLQKQQQQQQHQQQQEKKYESPAQEIALNKATMAFEGLRDKCLKDALNQQQSLLQTRRASEGGYAVIRRPDRHDQVEEDEEEEEEPEALNSNNGNNSNNNVRTVTSLSRHHHNSSGNKFVAKKNKIKRANTIDIPRELKIRQQQLTRDDSDTLADCHRQAGCLVGLMRRPIIDIDEHQSTSPVNPQQQSAKVVPSFEPKTINDHKFIALINRNNNEGSPYHNTSCSSPFKTFNYRQNGGTVTDKNWTSRFSNIKTAFDKSSSNPQETGTASPQFGNRPAKFDQNGFTHAPTSPFQKIQRPIPQKAETIHPKPGYMPKNSGLLKEKLKMFDHPEPEPVRVSNVSKIKNRLTKATSGPPNSGMANSKNSSHGHYQHQTSAETKLKNALNSQEHSNYYSFCKQFAPFANGSQTKSATGVTAAKNKLLQNFEMNGNDKHHYQDAKYKPKSLEHKVWEPPPAQNVYCTDKYSYKPACHPANNYIENKYDNYGYHLLPEEKHRLPNQSFDDGYALKSEKGIDKFDMPTQNVAVQTSNEPPRPELPAMHMTPELNYLQIHEPNPLVKLRNNASVQTYQVPEVYSNPSLRQNIRVDNRMPMQRLSYSGEDNWKRNHENDSQFDYHLPQESSIQFSKPNDYNNWTPGHPMETRTPLVKVPFQHQRYSDHFDHLPSTHHQHIHHHHHQFTNQENGYKPPPVAQIEPIRNLDQSLNDPQQKSVNDVPFKIPIINLLDDNENIQNQDISSEGVVTRYTGAIATVSSSTSPEPQMMSSPDEIRRHNMLQQNLIRQMKPDYLEDIPIKSAQEKITMFEEKSRGIHRQSYHPTHVPTETEFSSKPSRSSVLSKSESWHQLALNRANPNTLAVPQVNQLKPPKPKSPIRFSKQFEASCNSETVRKMEDKIQQYFQQQASGLETSSNRNNNNKRTTTRSFKSSRVSANSLARSQTMPHLYDERMFDEEVDVDQAFDNIFKEATKSEKRLL